MLTQFERLFFGLAFAKFAPDSGDGTGGSGDGDDGGDGDSGSDGGSQAVYTEQQFQEQIKRYRLNEQKKREKAIQEKDEHVILLQQKLTEMEQKLEKLEDSGDKGGEIELIKKSYDRKMSEIEARLQEEQRKREAAEQKQKSAQRDAMLRDAISRGKCRDVEAGYRYLIHNVVWDDELDDEEPTWKIKPDKGGAFIPITPENVAELLPDWMREADNNSGGAGTHSGARGRTRKQNDLDSAIQKLEDLRKLSQTEPSQQNVMRYMQQKRDVEKLQRELANSN